MVSAVPTPNDELIVFSALSDGCSGQVVRMAIALSAITLIPVKIEDIRDDKKTTGKHSYYSLLSSNHSSAFKPFSN